MLGFSGEIGLLTAIESANTVPWMPCWSASIAPLWTNIPSRDTAIRLGLETQCAQIKLRATAPSKRGLSARIQKPMVSQPGYVRVTGPHHARSTGILSLLLCFSLLVLQSAKLEAQMPQDSNTPPAKQILTSYEGQTVTSIDIAGRPDLKIAQFTSELAQQAGQPFKKQKVDTT